MTKTVAQKNTSPSTSDSEGSLVDSEHARIDSGNSTPTRNLDDNSLRGFFSDDSLTDIQAGTALFNSIDFDSLDSFAADVAVALGNDKDTVDSSTHLHAASASAASAASAASDAQPPESESEGHPTAEAEQPPPAARDTSPQNRSASASERNSSAFDPRSQEGRGQEGEPAEARGHPHTRSAPADK